ncbi:MAG: choice-of-anchor Q domain-containing protein [Isosphaeraceae bacterium]
MITNVSITSNKAKTGVGGGIFTNHGDLTFNAGSLSDNEAAGTSAGSGLGGAIYMTGGKVTIAGTANAPFDISDNAAAQGGGIYLTSGTITLSLAQLAHDTAALSGGAILNFGTVVLSNSTFSDDAAVADGGAIDNTGKLTINSSTLSANSAGQEGGSIDNAGAGNASITATTITSSASTEGGDIWNAATMAITTSTVSYGTASLNGGGIYDSAASTLNLSNSTIADNSSVVDGGGIYSDGSLTSVNATIALNNGDIGSGLDVDAGKSLLYNTIVDGNVGGNDVAGTLAAASSNDMFGSGADSLGGATNLFDISNPDLGTLADNGGTTLTIALEAGSPAIDAGANTIAGQTVPTLDQRGALRGTAGINAGANVDIGAYEASSSYMITSAADSLTIAGTLRSGIEGWAQFSANANPENIANPAPNTLVFNTAGTFAKPQTITLTLGTLVIPTAQPVAIDGPGGGVVTISGGGIFQVLDVPDGASLTLESVTITGGKASIGGGVENDGALSLINTIVKNNQATTGGGLSSTGTLSITGGTIEDNSALNGGGVNSVGGLVLDGATIEANTASEDGGGVDYSSGTGFKLTITGTTFTENHAVTGGGLYITSGAVSIKGGALTGNTATGGDGGGGLYDDGGGVTITGASLTGNKALTSAGGAIEIAAGDLTALEVTLENNAASVGGAIDNVGQATISASTISNNSATTSGGGLSNSGTLNLSSSSVASNTASGLGQGGGLVNSGTLTVTNSTLSSNSGVLGGGIANSSGTASLTNTTIADNTATTGGGIDNDLGTLTTLNTTIADNSVGTSGSGAGLYTTNNGATLYNTIVDANTTSGTANVYGTLSSSSEDNLINVAVPDLGPLANNGGPTLTIALLTGSGAIDGGANSISGQTVPSTDQRGALRGLAGINAGTSVDIGAYEASSSYAVTGSSTVDTTLSGTLRSAVGWANVSTNDNPENLANPAPNTIQVSSSQNLSFTLSPTLGTLVLSNTGTAEAIEDTGTKSVTISGGNTMGVLQVNKGVTADLSNLMITGGSATSGGGINNAGTLTLSGTTIMGNTASSGGGIANAGTLTLGSSTFNSSTVPTTIAGNQAVGKGGGVLDTGTLTLNGASITGNTAASGGGIAVTGTLTVSGSTQITGNSATGSGGGILSTGTLAVTGSTISGNTAATGGGIDNAGTLTLTDASIMTNSASTGSGGGLDNESGGSTTVSYSTVQGNSAKAGGGGIDNNSTLSISISTIASNTAGVNGGGIGDESGAALTLTNSTVSGNSATGSGGGLSVAGSASLSDATIANNKGGTGGGGVYSTGILTVVNATIADNNISSSGSGGGLDAAKGTAALFNTIVASNTSGTSTNNNAAGSLAPTSVNNLFGAGGSGGLGAYNGNLINVTSPDLGTLANNGGPTLTIALTAGSPAIDAGANTLIGQTVPATDQRGALRGSAGLDAGANVDIGAYEASSSYLVNTATDSTNVGTLRSGIEWANYSTNANPEALAAATANGGIAPANTVVFPTTGVFATPQTITLSPSLGPIVLATSTETTPVSIDGTSSNGLTLSGGGAVGVISVASGTTATLTGLTITSGHSTTGGAIDNAGNLTVTDSTLTGNSAVNGGAIANSGKLTLSSSTLNDNIASTDGGGIDNLANGNLTITNDTLASNTAADGGGIFQAGSLTAVNATIAYNVSGASSTGGGLDAPSGTSLLYNSIVAQNTDGTGNDDVAGTLSSYSADNLFGTGGSGGLTSANGNLLDVTSPGLGTLSDNGGPTLTIPLALTSPAVNAGSSSLPDAPEVDQRGALRGVGDVLPNTSIDIGAYEVSSSYLVTSPADSSVPGTLRSAINYANINSGTSRIYVLFDTKGAFSSPQTITLTLGTLDVTETAEPITIEGPGANIVTISGGGDSGVFSVASGVTATFSGITIADGSAGVSGGGAVNNAGTLTVANSLLTDNASGAGSGAGIVNTGTLTVTGSAFSGDVAAYYGGAIYNDDGTATVSDTNFVDNTAVYGLGGAIDNQGGMLTVNGSTFQGNSSFQGAAIFNREGTVSITDTTLSDNSAYQGGAIFSDGTVASPGIMTVTDSTIADNSAFQGGGVSNNYGGTLTIVDSTLANNSATQYGGAIDNVGTLTITSGTLAYNTVAAGGIGGGIDVYGGTAALYDSIVVLNTDGTGTSATADDINGSVSSSSSYNLIGVGGLTNGVNDNLVGVTKPGLAAGLANNGGPTQTIALLAGSPALGAGSATIAGVTIPDTDQTGTFRPADKFDIGAYQSSLLPTPVVTTSAKSISASSAANSTVASVAAPPTTVITNAVVSSIVSAPSPFAGRKLGSTKHHKAAKVKPTPHTAAQHSVRTVSVKPKGTTSVRIEKRR